MSAGCAGNFYIQFIGRIVFQRNAHAPFVDILPRLRHSLGHLHAEAGIVAQAAGAVHVELPVGPGGKAQVPVSGVGMALSGTLQNFAGGVLILLIKPYKVGDYIVFGEYKGYVKEIQIFHTILTTYSNEKIIIPNGGLSTGTINNFSAEKYHRLEWHVSIAYGDDVKRARQVVLDILHADRRILKDFLPDEIAAIETVQPKTETDSEKNTSFWKSIFNHHKVKQKVDDIKQLGQQQLAAKMPKKDCTPYVAVDSLGDSAVVLVVRAWTTTENYWSVLYDTYECIYERLPQEGLHFPYPQMDVYLKKN